MSVGMTGRHMTGRHRRTGTASTFDNFRRGVILLPRAFVCMFHQTGADTGDADSGNRLYTT